jgi:hypothetical protein
LSKGCKGNAGEVLWQEEMSVLASNVTLIESRKYKLRILHIIEQMFHFICCIGAIKEHRSIGNWQHI